MKYLESIVLLSLVCFLVHMGATNSNNKPFNAYQNTRAILVNEYPKTSQFCLTGAAFILTGDSDRAVQYEKHFGKCMNKIVDKYKHTIIM